MNVLNIYSDKEIYNEDSDAYKRHQKYASILDGKYFVHYVDKFYNQTQRKNINYVTTTKNHLKTIIKLKKLIKKENIDLIVVPRPFLSGIIAVIIKLLTNKKILLSVYGSNIYRKEWFLESLRNFIFRFTIGPIIFKSSDYMQIDGIEDLNYINKIYPKKKTFWKPMIPDNIKDFLKITKDTDSKEFNLIFIGRLVKQKNIKLLSKIIEGSLKINNKLKYTLIGDGKLKSCIQKLIKSFPNNILWIKKVDRKEIVDYYKKSSVLLVCSRYEGFPRIFMEAAGSATPIITSRVSGIEKLIEDNKSGYVLEQKTDIEKYIDKIEYLYNNRNKIYQMGQNLRINLIKNFDLELTLIKQKEIFDYIKKEL